MARLTDSPSQGQSEVLDTLHYFGSHTHGQQVQHIVRNTAARWGGDEGRAGADAQFETDFRTVLSALATAGYVVGRDDVTGASVDLTGSPGPTTRVVLTGVGRATARHPRPRPVRIFD